MKKLLILLSLCSGCEKQLPETPLPKPKFHKYVVEKYVVKDNGFYKYMVISDDGYILEPEIKEFANIRLRNGYESDAWVTLNGGNK